MNLIKAARQNLKTFASGHSPYDAGSRGRRGFAWSGTQLGLNTVLYSQGLTLLERSRDTVRNNCWASAAIDSYTANAVGKGIRMVPQHPDTATRKLLSDRWDAWTKQCDMECDPEIPGSGRLDFYSLQSLAAREIMEGGEVFTRLWTRVPTPRMRVGLQIQLMEAEQLPIWRNDPLSVIGKNQVRCGIEYQPDGRRAAYHFWKQHPGETMFFGGECLDVERLTAREVIHSYKSLRAGQMRGAPWLLPVLTKLRSLDGYFDSEVFRKEVSSMITGFIEQAAPNDPIYQRDSTVVQPTDLSTQVSKIEPGSFPVLNPGEKITLAEVKDSGDFQKVIQVGLQAFAVGMGLSEYQVSGNLQGISYSSIRAGLLEFRRKCEQFQHGVLIHQFCVPIYQRWLMEGMMSMAFGRQLLDQYMANPEPFEDARWVTPGWPWVDPEKDIKAFESACRDGFTSRTHVCATQGVDSEDIDREQIADNKRADDNKLSYDSDGRKVVSGRNAGLTEEEIAKDNVQVQPS